MFRSQLQNAAMVSAVESIPFRKNTEAVQKHNNRNTWEPIDPTGSPRPDFIETRDDIFIFRTVWRVRGCLVHTKVGSDCWNTL